MRQLLPHPDESPDLRSLLPRDDRRPRTDRPWVMANMVTSIDGAYSLEGVSGGLSSPTDRAIFHALRAAADVILVAAGTARTERYRRPTTTAELLPWRRSAGLTDVPRLAVVSRSVSIPADQPFLRGDGPDPLLLHPAVSDTRDVPHGVELRCVGDEEVDLTAALASLRHDGAEVVLCEGGPRLLGQLHRLGLLDELFLTLAPRLVGGDELGLLSPAAVHPTRQHLHRVWEDEEFLFLTYRTAQDAV
ncbi:MAG: dihydrofolate reductase family protein [Microthrixaceae bacterium]